MIGYEYKQTRNLIHGMTEKVKPDFSMKAKLFKRKREFSRYIHKQEDSMTKYTSSIFLLPETRLTQSMSGGMDWTGLNSFRSMKY